MALNFIKAGNLAKVEYLELMERTQRPEDKDNPVVYNLPREGHEELWAYMNRSENICRRIVIASIAKGDAVRFVVEFEQRATGECSTLLIWDPVNEVLKSEIVAAVEECITNNAAYLLTNTFGHAWSRLKHSWKKNEHIKPDHFLERIFSAEPLLKEI